MPNPWGARQPTARPDAANDNPLAGLPAMGMPAMGIPPMGGVDPDQVAAMLDNPAVAEMMSSLFNNPAFVDQMAAANPLMAPVLRDPAMRGMLANPAAIRASLQLQRAFGGRPGSLPSTPLLATPAPSSAVQALDFSSLLGGSGASSGSQTAAPATSAVGEPTVSAAVQSESRQPEDPTVRFAAQVLHFSW